jgi:hypothetical protein
VDWHKIIEFDYALNILGAHQILQDVPSESHESLSKLKGGLSKYASPYASPNEIKDFFSSLNLLTEPRIELIKDYEYYIENKNH